MAYTTKKSLLQAIKDGCDVSWFEFYETYRPLILMRGSDYNLSEAEKKELIQEVLLSVSKGNKTFTYDQSKGRFRSYLRKIISRRAVDIIRKRKDNAVSPEILEQYPENNPALDKAWQQEWHAHVLSQALQVLRTKVEPQTFQAFELYVLEEMSAKEVADFLKIKVDMVYVAKSRAIKSLREIMKELPGE
jgi:RNA polymerase sigma factor (sigma-70 family)